MGITDIIDTDYDTMMRGFAYEVLGISIAEFKRVACLGQPALTKTDVTHLSNIDPDSDTVVMVTRQGDIQSTLKMSLQEAFDASLQRALHGRLMDQNQSYTCIRWLEQEKVQVDPNFIISLKDPNITGCPINNHNIV